MLRTCGREDGRVTALDPTTVFMREQLQFGRHVCATFCGLLIQKSISISMTVADECGAKKKPFP